MNHLLISGALAGVITSIIFVVVHNILISKIWFITPFAVIIGALTGISLGWAYTTIYENLNTNNLVFFLLIFSLPMVIIEFLTFFSERKYTIDELTNQQTFPTELLIKTFIPIIPVLLVAGFLIGWIFGKTYEAIFASIVANSLILIGIGHNVPILNQVIIEDNFLLIRGKIILYGILVIMVVSFGISMLAIDRVIEPN